MSPSLGAESTSSFEDRLGEWLGHRLLALVAGGNVAVRMHPDTQVDLLRLCEEKGVAWVRSCHQAAWAYYRERFAEEPENVSAAGEAVHHALALGEFDAAYVALFAQQSVERWRQQGLSMRIEPILEELRSVSRIAGLSATQEQRAGIDVARAHVASDLGRPRLCLEHLMAAQQDLDGIARTAEVERTLRGLWMQLAVSHANLGDTARCIECYHRVISSDDLVMETQTALCMGYLGYEYCDFEDFASAHYWTRRALDDCPCERSPQVFSKNLSNRGIVLYFIGDLAAAAAHLRSAVDLVSNPASPAYDVREHGRALSHWAMIELSRGRPTLQVDSLLAESLKLTRQAGDERRIALTHGRIGIVAGVTGDFARSEELLHQAVVAHHRVGDLRNMIFELLALLSIRHRRLFGSYGSHLKDLERAAQGISADLAHLIHGSIARPDKTYLVDFWTHCQRPRVFADRPS